MPSDIPRFTIRINPKLISKMRYIADENGRSINKELEQLIKRYIADYERDHGAIVVDDE